LNITSENGWPGIISVFSCIERLNFSKMTPLKRVTYIFEFILAAHMVFSLLIEIHSIVYPMHVLSEMLDQMPPYKRYRIGHISRPKNPHANHNEIFDFISFFGFCIWLGLKYLFEGLRFNTLIVCAAELFFFLDRVHHIPTYRPFNTPIKSCAKWAQYWPSFTSTL
jgi:hypothetical protein